MSDPPTLRLSAETAIHWVRLHGIVDNNTAMCTLKDAYGNKGRIELTFVDPNRINVDIEYTDMNETHSGTFIFRPYNLMDIPDAKISQTYFPLYLNRWGDVYLKSVMTTGNKPYPRAYLTNESNDIFYELRYFHVGSDIFDAIAEDYNGDGLNDILVTTHFHLADDIEHLKWYFFQMSDGWFYLDTSVPDNY